MWSGNSVPVWYAVIPKPSRNINALTMVPIAGGGMAVRRDPPASIRVLIAENRTLLRLGILDALGRAPDIMVLSEAYECADATADIELHEPDVVIVGSLDDCVEPTEATRKIAMGCSVWTPRFLTIVDVRDAVRVEVAQDGTTGALLLNASPDELASAVRMLSAGYSFFSTRAGYDAAAGAAQRAAIRARSPDARNITDREFDVLSLVARGCTNTEISERLRLSESTVKTHVQSLLQKLRVRNRASVIIYAYENGLIRIGDNLMDVPMRYGYASTHG